MSVKSITRYDRTAEYYIYNRFEVAVEGLWQDLRYATRLLRRTPRNSGTVVAILALGIGANTAVFSAVNHVLLRPLPFSTPDRLIRVRDAVVSADGQLHPFNMGPRDILALREAAVFDGVIGFGGTNMTLVGGDLPERVSVVLQTEGIEQTLNVTPSLGRGFSQGELRQGVASGVAIISDGLWKTHFGGSPAALGSTMRLDDRRFAVIGVMPPLYAFPYQAQIWLPIALDPSNRSQDFAVFGRMRVDTTLAQVRAVLRDVARTIRQRYPDVPVGFGFEAMTIQENLSGDQTGTLRALTTTVGFLLLTACVNVATLLLARSVARRREFAIRAVLGASLSRHVRQLLAEALVLAGLGCCAGLLIANWLSTFTATLIPSVLSEQLGLATLRTEWRVAGFAIGISLVSAFIAAVIPALGSWNDSPQTALADGGRTTSGRGGWMLGGLIVAETAVTLVLLAAAGLIVQNFLRLRSHPLGFEPHGLVAIELMPPPAAYASSSQRATLIRRVVEEVGAVPGVSVAATTVNPLGGGTWGSPVISEDAAARDPNAVFNVNYRLITPGLLEAMRIPLLRGRSLEDQDREGSVAVAIVSAGMAARFWPDQDAIGKRVRIARPGTPWVTVVGIAGDVDDSHDPGVPLETWYLPFAQHGGSPAAAHVYLMVRAHHGDPLAVVPEVQRAIWRVDKTLAPYGITAMDSYRSASIARERVAAAFMLSLSAFGLALAALGVYGVMAFSVAQRTAEIGIRLALGGRPRDILPLVLQRGLVLVAVGMGVGLVAAVLVNRVLARILTQVGSLDVPALAGAALLILTAAIVACVLPAVKAARLDPLVALSSD